MTPNAARRLLAAVLVIATASLTLNLPSLAADAVVLRGRVLAEDGLTPVSGAVVTLVEVDGEKTFASDPSSEQGTFRLDSAPAGRYALVVESTDGAFLATDNLALRAGQTQPVTLTLKAGAGESGEEAPQTVPNSENRRRWRKWVFAGVVAISAAGAMYFVTKEEDAASPF